jgi:ABC-type glycerol-3-phosphate transport system substrate-binding protein
MSRNSRTLLGLLAALLLTLLAAACGGGEDGDTGASGQTGAGATTGGEQVSGNVSVMGIWTGEEQKSFQAVIDAFNEQQPDVTVKYNPVGDNLPTVLSTAVQGGNPPDIADIAQPGLIQGFVDQGAAKPIDFMEDSVQENFGDSIVTVGTFNDEFYGLMFKAANKSTYWYNVQAFSDAGVEATDDWDTFLENAQTLKASGIPAFSIAGANGWTLTDLFENIYIRTAGADKYDQLSKHEIPWTDQSVKDALTEMAKIVGDGSNIAGGTNGALQDDFPTSVGNVLSDNPKAAIVIEGDFVPGSIETTLKPQEGYDVSNFPNINGSPPSVVGGGDIMTMFNDTPAARAFMEFLATPEAAQAWAERGGFSSANKNLDPSVYPDEILRETASAIGEAEVFRFDLSDLQPAEFGATEGQGLWKLFQDFLKNPNDVDGIAQQMEAAAAKAFGN